MYDTMSLLSMQLHCSELGEEEGRPARVVLNAVSRLARATSPPAGMESRAPLEPVQQGQREGDATAKGGVEDVLVARQLKDSRQPDTSHRWVPPALHLNAVGGMHALLPFTA